METSDAVRARRQLLGLSQAEAATAGGLSEPQWRKIEKGLDALRMRHGTKTGIATALRWPPDAIDRIVDGEDPDSFPTVEPVTQPHEIGTDDDLAYEVLRLRAEVAKLAKLVRESIEQRSDDD